MNSSIPDGAAALGPMTNGEASFSGAVSPAREPLAERERLALAVAGVGVWEFEPRQRRFALDEIARRLLGLGGEPAGDLPEDTVLLTIAADDRERVREALHGAAAQGGGYDEIFRVQIAHETHWLHSIGRAPDVDGSGRLIGVCFDATAEGQALAARDLLLREMNHRIKNLFAVIGGLISLCAREAESPRALADDLGNRIAAMGRAHSLTQYTPAQNAGIERPLDLRELIEAVLEPARIGHTILIEGQALAVPTVMLTPLALIFQEWATNAAKYGALADPAGSLAVRWHTDDSGVTAIEWTEACVHTRVAGLGLPGFGTRLIEATVAQLHARLTGEQGDGFLRRRIEIGGLG